MKIDEIGGEFELIDKLSLLIPTGHADLIVGLGDDAAVIRTSPEPAPYMLVTTDILVENSHFKRQWAKPEQIGIKAAECNISDIAAMGGRPTWMFISLVLTHDTDLSWVQNLYAGISMSCSRYGVIVAGGDTTQGTVNTINITLLGHVAKDHLCLRSDARPGDLLAVTGTLGASAAACELLNQKRSPSGYLLAKHLEPVCRMDVAETIAPLANAMIDISDGLGSEVHHICRQSGVGAEIITNDIPVHAEVKKAGKELQMDPSHFALSGGEDYELLFTITPENKQKLDEKGVSPFVVGRILKSQKDIWLTSQEGQRSPLPGGYNHFA